MSQNNMTNAEQVTEENLPNQMNADGVLIVHSKSEYRRLKEQGVHVILQQTEQTDDGFDDLDPKKACSLDNMEECESCT